MNTFYEKIDSLLGNSLTGECLTTIRNQNSKLASKFEKFEEKNILEMDSNFRLFLSNYLILRNHSIVTLEENTITAVKNTDGLTYIYSFVYDFADQDDNLLKLKILDKGLKTGISLIDSKYLFVVSINKKQFFLLNCEKLKDTIKENIKKFNLLTEGEGDSKNQFLNFKLSDVDQKTLIFNLK